MAVYLGNYGRIELTRKSDGSRFNSVVNASDLNTSLKRFSFDFDPGCLVTGDQIQIKAVAPANTTANFSPSAVSTASDGITIATNLGFTANSPIRFSVINSNTGAAGTGTLPAPLVANTTYYVRSYAPSTGVLQVSTTPNGAAVNITTTGTATSPNVFRVTYYVQLLSFIASSGWGNNTQQSQWTGFINVDELGGIRLYDTFLKAVNGGAGDAISLVALAATTNIPVEVAVQNTSSRVLGQVTNYELNTQREAVDSTALSDQFRSQYSSLISGSGQITCFWDYKDTVAGGTYETAQYLLQLALRTEIGGEFSARLYLKPPNYHPDNTQGQIDDSLYYEVNGILTATAIQYTTTTIVEMTADFITTGPIRLKVNID